MKRIMKKNQVVLTLLAVMIAVAGYLNYTADGKMQDAQMASGEGQISQNQQGVLGELLDISEEDILAENKALSAALQESFGDSTEEIRDTGMEPSQEGGSKLSDSQETANQAQEKGDAFGEETDDENVQDTGKDTPGTAVLTSGTTVLDYVAGVQLSREQTRAKNKESLMEIIDNANLEEEQKQSAIDTMLKLTAIAEKETAAESLLAAKGFENSVVYINDKSVDVVICRTTLTDAERAQIEDVVKRKAEVTADKIVITLLEIAG